MSYAESWESELRAEWIAGVKFQKKTWSWSIGGGRGVAHRKEATAVGR